MVLQTYPGRVTLERERMVVVAVEEKEEAGLGREGGQPRGIYTHFALSTALRNPAGRVIRPGALPSSFRLQLSRLATQVTAYALLPPPPPNRTQAAARTSTRGAVPGREPSMVVAIISGVLSKGAPRKKSPKVGISVRRWDSRPRATGSETGRGRCCCQWRALSDSSWSPS